MQPKRRRAAGGKEPGYMAQKAMRSKRIFRLTNSRVRLGVGILLAALFCIQCNNTGALNRTAFVTWVSGTQIGQTPEHVRSRLLELAKEDQTELLRLGLKRYGNTVQDYTCTFIKQERISGQLRPEQWMEAKFREEPFSVSMRLVKNIPLGDRVLYVEGKYNGMMLIRPKGKVLRGLLGTVARDPRSRQVMENTLRPITEFGFRRSLESLLAVYELAERRGEAVNRYEGVATMKDGSQAFKLVRLLPPREDYPAKRTVLYLDVDNLVPLGVEGYDWDDQLICRYYFQDVRFNTGLTDEDFTPQANEMKPPKL